jgi:hypothetical protein
MSEDVFIMLLFFMLIPVSVFCSLFLGFMIHNAYSEFRSYKKNRKAFKDWVNKDQRRSM